MRGGHIIGVGVGVVVAVLSSTAVLAKPVDYVPCTAEETCYNTSAWRCVEAPAGVAGAACTLDYGYNTTSTCVCSSEGTHATCVNGTYPPPTGRHAHGRNGGNGDAVKQLLVIGDSVSLGYFGTVQTTLEYVRSRHTHCE